MAPLVLVYGSQIEVRYQRHMWEVSPELRTLLNIIFLAITGAIAYHGIRYRDEEGNTDIVRLLFGCIAATFFFLVLFQDVLGVVRFG